MCDDDDDEDVHFGSAVTDPGGGAMLVPHFSRDKTKANTVCSRSSNFGVFVVFLFFPDC